MNTNILLTSGRAPVTLELARLFHQAGYQVFIAESLEKHLCLYSKAVSKSFLVPSPRQNCSDYIQALISIIQQYQIHWLIPTCEEIYYISHGLEKLKQHCQVFCEPLHKLQLLHNKWTFIQQAKQLNFPVPQTWLATSQKELEFILNQPEIPKKTVLKPVYSRFASQVIFYNLKQKLPQLQINPENPWVVQEWIGGQQFCSYSLAHQGKITAHATYQASFTVHQGSCIYFQPIEQLEILNWVKNFVEQQQLTGQIGFDFIINPEGQVYPLECNPRATSGIHLFQLNDHLEQAFFNPSLPILTPQAETKAMLALPMLIYGLPNALLTGQLKDWFQRFLSTRDVVFDWSDPAPFLGQISMINDFFKISRTHQINLIQASTQDIEWNGELLS